MASIIEPLAPNKIHSLPVQVSYHLQSSSQTFSAVFALPQQVYVHPNAGSKVDGQDEAWGAIYLKTVVQGIMMASPELHPAHPGTPDLSLYVLDPRETYLRKSRAAPVSDMRSSPSPSSPGEVWTGKGLVSWALDEPAQGKNLITGRIVRRSEFAGVSAVDDNVCALAALAAANASGAADDGQAWGIEISLGLKSGMLGAGNPLPLHPTVESGSAAAQAACLALPPNLPPTPRKSTPAPQRRLLSESRPLHHAPSIGIPRITTPARTCTTSNPPSSAGSASRAPLPSSSGRGGRPRKRKVDDDRTLSSVDMNVPHPSSTPARSDAGLILPKAEDLTQEKVQELLKNGAFLQMLEQITGAPLTTMAAKKAEAEENVTKRARFDDKETKETGSQLKCSNCSTTRSSVWRTKKSDDGTSVRVCNACGLWYNKTRTMRPKEFWTTGDEEPQRRGRTNKGRGKKAAAAAAAAATDRGLKRTLTQVAERDAQRIADMRKGPQAPASAPQRAAPPPKPKAVPMTSPSASAPKTAVRNAKFAAATNVAASSPGGWAQPLDAPASTPASTASVGVAESPNTVLRRMLDSAMPSLAMPLSDDGAEAGPSTVNWNTDLSAFFNVDGFAMAPGSTARNSPAQRISDVAGVSSVLRTQTDEMDTAASATLATATSEDDVFSQLFQRTSSMGDFDATSHASSPFDFSQLPPSSPPALPSNLPHSALLLSSPSASPHDYSPSDTGKVSPARPGSGLRNELKGPDTGDAVLHELLSKFAEGVNESGIVNEELMALFNSFPAAA